MAAKLDVAKIIRNVRGRLGLSQEGLSRRLHATKGAVQHWERGRNRPDLARLIALRQICPSGAERQQLDALIKATQGRITELPEAEVAVSGGGGASLLQKEYGRLRKQLVRSKGAVRRQEEENRRLRKLVRALQLRSAR